MQGSFIVACFSVYWILTGAIFMLGWAPRLLKSSVMGQPVHCTDHVNYEILQYFLARHTSTHSEAVDFDTCLFSSLMQAVCPPLAVASSPQLLTRGLPGSPHSPGC